MTLAEKLSRQGYLLLKPQKKSLRDLLIYQSLSSYVIKKFTEDERVRPNRPTALGDRLSNHLLRGFMTNEMPEAQVSSIDVKRNLVKDFLTELTLPVLEKLVQDLGLPSVKTKPNSHGFIVNSKQYSKGRLFPWHRDADYDGFKNLSINFWVPFQDCGETRPSLYLFEAPVGITRNLKNLPKGNTNRGRSTDIDWESVTNDTLEKAVAEDLGNHKSFSRVKHVKANAGDVICMTNFTVHKSDDGQAFDHPRVAGIIRYELTDVPEKKIKNFFEYKNVA